MSRFAQSPLINDRSIKRTKLTTEPELSKVPEDIADVVPDGDIILVLSGLSAMPDKPIGLRVSSYSLSQASPIFKTLCASAKQAFGAENRDGDKVVVTLQDDDGDAMFTLVNILHLRNDKLPTRLMPSALSKLAYLAHKYQSVVAAGRATTQWFDHLYASATTFNIWEIVEAAYLLDEPLFFARFSSRWVLQQPVFGRQVPATGNSETQRLGFLLAESHVQAQISLRNDIDALADTALIAASADKKHHIDYAPEMSPDPDDTDEGKVPGYCHVDSEAAWEYLGALRDARIFPSALWKGATTVTIGDVVDSVNIFRAPDYNDLDKCDFCEDVKALFTTKLGGLKKEHEKRLWGLCLDCYKAGGINVAECRFEHAKPVVEVMRQDAGAGGLGINGL